MTTLKQTALDYESTQIQNIADLDVIPTDVQVLYEKDCEFPYYYAIIDGIKYRVPKTVLINLKVMLEDNPNITKVKIKKQGEGRDTKYTVIPKFN